MELTTYEFYTNTYYGNAVSESQFTKWHARACDKLQYICSGRITEDALENYSDEIQKATCAVIDVLFNIDFAEVNATNTEFGNIKSMSSGGQSVSFGSNETIYNKALGDKNAQNKLIIEAAKEYLYNTGLIYGVI